MTSANSASKAIPCDLPMAWRCPWTHPSSALLRISTGFCAARAARRQAIYARMADAPMQFFAITMVRHDSGRGSGLSGSAMRVRLNLRHGYTAWSPTLVRLKQSRTLRTRRRAGVRPPASLARRRRPRIRPLSTRDVVRSRRAEWRRRTPRPCALRRHRAARQASCASIRALRAMASGLPRARCAEFAARRVDAGHECGDYRRNGLVARCFCEPSSSMRSTSASARSSLGG